jgi:hypothetical protein
MKSDGSTLAIGATLTLAAAGALAQASGSRSSTKDREDDFASLPTLTTDRAAAETGARRLRAELADPQGLGRNFGQLSESERFYRDFLMRDLGQLEEAFGPSIGKAPMRSAARRAYRASYEADEDDEG